MTLHSIVIYTYIHVVDVYTILQLCVHVRSNVYVHVCVVSFVFEARTRNTHFHTFTTGSILTGKARVTLPYVCEFV